MKRFFLLLLLSFAFVGLSAHAEPTEVVGKDLEVRVSDDGFIRGLKYSAPVLATNGVGDSLRSVVLVRGVYDHEGWQLFAEGPGWNRPVKLSKRGTFALQMPITSETISVRFEARGPGGETESETLLVQTSKLELIVVRDVLMANDYLVKITPFVSLFSIDAIDRGNNSTASFKSNFEPGALLTIRFMPSATICPYISGMIQNLSIVPSAGKTFDLSSVILWRAGGGLSFRLGRTSRYAFSLGASYSRDFLVSAVSTSVLTLLPVELAKIEMGNMFELHEDSTYAIYLDVGLRFPLSRIISGVSVRNGSEIDGSLVYVNRFQKGFLGISQLQLAPFVSKAQLNANTINLDTTSFGLRVSVGW